MMKTLAANLGLGDARRDRRNARVQHTEARGWGFKRRAFLHRNIKFSAAAKATRCAMEVTQAEVAKAYRVSQGTVCNWESGKYAWRGGTQELAEYTRTISWIARG